MYFDRLIKIVEGLEARIQEENLPANTKKQFTEIVEELRRITEK